MSTTVEYKNNVITTVENETKVLTTSGKWMEDDITLTDVSGGASGGEVEKQINFIDYDGAVVASYTAEEWASVTALPANPSHDGLTAQGWNWTKAQIDAELQAIPEDNIYVGQMYITESGDTEIDIDLASAYRRVYFQCAVNGSVSLDWGDGTSAITVTGTSLTSRKANYHNYTNAGKYTITVSVSSGTFNFYGVYSSNSTIRIPPVSSGDTSAYSISRNSALASSIMAIRLGNNAGIGKYGLYYCLRLKYITLPKTTTNIDNYAIYQCLTLVQLTIPTSITDIPEYCISSSAVESICLPPGILSIGSDAFYDLERLARIHIPNGITTIGTNALGTSYGIKKLVIPGSIEIISSSIGGQPAYIILKDGITTIGTGSSVFSSSNLLRVDIPETVTSIGDSAFTGLGIVEYHIRANNVPTLGTSAFTAISTMKIFVPEESVDAYKAATNWSSYESYIVGE